MIPSVGTGRRASEPTRRRSLVQASRDSSPGFRTRREFSRPSRSRFLRPSCTSYNSTVTGSGRTVSFRYECRTGWFECALASCEAARVPRRTDSPAVTGHNLRNLMGLEADEIGAALGQGGRPYQPVLMGADEQLLAVGNAEFVENVREVMADRNT